MIEKTVMDYLTGVLTCPVYVGAPERKDGLYVTIEKTENQRYYYVEKTTLSIISWADSIYEAAKLNDTVKTEMLQLEDVAETVSSCELDSDYNFSDTALKKYGYQALFSICHI
jgi:predicted HTH transcriptional regulator